MTLIHDPNDPTTFQPASEIPANPNSLQNGATDPQPEKGPKGSWRRSVVSWIKGWFTPA